MPRQSAAGGVSLSTPLRSPARHRLEAHLIAAGGEAGQHACHDPVGQQVGRGERLVGPALVVTDAAHPRTADGKAPPAERDHAVVAAVPRGDLVGVVSAFRAGQLRDLGLHQLGHHLQPHRRRGG
jgi:hypothetical protein